VKFSQRNQPVSDSNAVHMSPLLYPTPVNAESAHS